jgi:predicted O-linked N-acetylglucosamine transferase (SPINDLY family)
LPEGVSFNVSDHEALARRLIANPNERQAWRQRRREARSRSPLFDTHGFVIGFDEVLNQLWQAKLAAQRAG